MTMTIPSSMFIQSGRAELAKLSHEEKRPFLKELAMADGFDHDTGDDEYEYGFLVGIFTAYALLQQKGIQF